MTLPKKLIKRWVDLDFFELLDNLFVLILRKNKLDIENFKLVRKFSGIA